MKTAAAPVLLTDIAAAAALIQCSAILGECLQSTVGFTPSLPRLQLHSVQETRYEGILQLFLVFFAEKMGPASLEVHASWIIQSSPTKVQHIPDFRSIVDGEYMLYFPSTKGKWSHCDYLVMKKRNARRRS